MSTQAWPSQRTRVAIVGPSPACPRPGRAAAGRPPGPFGSPELVKEDDLLKELPQVAPEPAPATPPPPATPDPIPPSLAPAPLAAVPQRDHGPFGSLELD